MGWGQDGSKKNLAILAMNIKYALGGDMRPPFFDPLGECSNAIP